MAVLTTYHKLVERDAKYIDIQWKIASIVLLICAIISSLMLSTSLHKIISDYDDRCVLGANFEFTEQSSSFRKATNESSDDTEEPSSVTSTQKFATLSDYFDDSYASFLKSENTNQQFPVEQVQFLANHKIDDITTVWGKKSTCDFGLYIPIAQSCFGIIVTVMFIICGKGGKADSNSFLPQPWRIVTPAIIFFLVMTILSIVNLVIVQGGLDAFCDSFKPHLPDIDCHVAINRFMVKPLEGMAISPGTNRTLVTVFNYFAFGCWLLSLLVLLARIICVVDFHLVRVTVKTIEFEKADETTSLRVTEVEQNGNENESRARLATTEC